jgi:hypothetical protein
MNRGPAVTRQRFGAAPAAPVSVQRHLHFSAETSPSSVSSAKAPKKAAAVPAAPATAPAPVSTAAPPAAELNVESEYIKNLQTHVYYLELEVEFLRAELDKRGAPSPTGGRM